HRCGLSTLFFELPNHTDRFPTCSAPAYPGDPAGVRRGPGRPRSIDRRPRRGPGRTMTERMQIPVSEKAEPMAIMKEQVEKEQVEKAQPDLIEKESGLARQLSQRQLAMLATGGAIGTGLFLGSSFAVRAAGPSVIITYLLGALVALLLMGA